LVNHLLSDREVFPTVIEVVDEICDVLATPVENTQALTRTILTYYIKNPSAVKRVRDELE